MVTLGAPERAQHQATAPRSPTRRPALPAALLLAGLGTGLPVTAAAPADAAADPLHRDLYFSFDDVDADGLPLLDALGVPDVVATVSSADGGKVLAGPDRNGHGHSLRFERFQPDQPATPAVVVVRPVAGAADVTEPGDRPFSFGAEFALDQLTGVSSNDNGDNLVQRGLFGVGAQYKIQLDAGHPSCRVAGSEGTVTVHAAEAVEPEQWYRVRCRRAGDAVTLRVVSSVDSVKQVSEYTEHGLTGTLTYGAGDSPFSIGGKVDENGHVLVGASDQFNGLVDDVFFRSLG
jgi:hypothetical protein